MTVHESTYFIKIVSYKAIMRPKERGNRAFWLVLLRDLIDFKYDTGNFIVIGMVKCQSNL